MIPFGFGQLMREFVGAGDAGVVHQYVYGSKSCGNIRDSARHLRLTGDIDMPVGGVEALRPQPGCEFFAFDIEYVEQCEARASCANRKAHARPMPSAAPVTMQTLSFTRFMALSLGRARCTARSTE